MAQLSPCFIGELYHNAAKRNPLVVEFIREFQKSNPDDVECIRTQFSTIRENCIRCIAHEFVLFTEIGPDIPQLLTKRVSGPESYLIPSGFDDNRFCAMVSNSTGFEKTWNEFNNAPSHPDFQELLRIVDIEWENDTGYDFFDTIQTIAKAIDDKREPDSCLPILDPRVIRFALTIPGFPNSNWESLSAFEKYLHGRVLVDADGGAVPSMGSLCSEITSNDIIEYGRRMARYQSCGRFMNRYHIVIDWAYSDEEICAQFAKLLKHQTRPSVPKEYRKDTTRIEPKKLDDHDKHTLWPDFAFSQKVDTIAFVSSYLDKLWDSNLFESEIREITDLLDFNTVITTTKPFTPDENLLKACWTLVNKERKTPGIMINPGLSDKTITKYYPMRMAEFIMFLRSGLYLPNGFQKAYDARSLVRMSAINPLPINLEK